MKTKPPGRNEKVLKTVYSVYCSTTVQTKRLTATERKNLQTMWDNRRKGKLTETELQSTDLSMCAGPLMPISNIVEQATDAALGNVWRIYKRGTHKKCPELPKAKIRGTDRAVLRPFKKTQLCFYPIFSSTPHLFCGKKCSSKV